MNPTGAAIDHASHTPYSDPGSNADRIDGLTTDPAEVSAVARNLIVHYRASGHELPETGKDDIDARWLERILDLDRGRHPGPLTEERPVTERVQGCCRDHTLFCVGVLRHHGVPARSRVGFAGYFLDTWHHDHVVVEAWLDGRWQRFDAEVEAPTPALPTPLDMGTAPIDGTGFVTAAQVWAAYRSGDLDPASYGVAPEVPLFAGPRFVFDEVIYEVAHRFGDELLLWDGWGRMGVPGSAVTDDEVAWLDPVVELLLAADSGDEEAERRLLDRYRSDDGLHPGPTVRQESPYGNPAVEVDLASR